MPTPARETQTGSEATRHKQEEPVSFSHATRPAGICPEVQPPSKSESPKGSFTECPDKAKPLRKQTRGTTNAHVCPPPRTRGRSDGTEESLGKSQAPFHRRDTGAAPPTRSQMSTGDRKSGIKPISQCPQRFPSALELGENSLSSAGEWLLLLLANCTHSPFKGTITLTLLHPRLSLGCAMGSTSSKGGTCDPSLVLLIHQSTASQVIGSETGM